MLDAQRPLDHGAWVPLRYLRPEADLPVVQLSLPRTRTPGLLLAAGRALAPFRHRGALILGSGEAEPRPWAVAFQRWVHERLAAGDGTALAEWRQAPGAVESVPTSEHLDPLFVAMGAGGTPPGLLFAGWQLGSLSLTTYEFP